MTHADDVRQDTKEVARGELVRILTNAEDHAIVPLLVTGASMSPTLLDRRSVVYLERDRAYVPRRGDMVLFCREDGAVVLHRVWRVAKDGRLLINGDAQRWTETIAPEQVIARVVRFCRTRREIGVDRFGYRLYVCLWIPLRPLHPQLWRFCYLCSRLPHKLKGGKKS